MPEREQMESWVVLNGKNRIARVLGSNFGGLERYCGALVDEGVDGEGCEGSEARDGTGVS